MLKQMTTALATLTLAVGLAAPAFAKDTPPGWLLTGTAPDKFVAVTAPSHFDKFKACGMLKSTDWSSFHGFGTLMQMFQANTYRGKRVRLSGYLKTLSVKGWTGMWMRVDGPDGRVESFDNMQDRALKGDNAWKSYDIVLDVPSDARDIALGVLQEGPGISFLGGTTLTVVGNATPTTAKPERTYPPQPVNLDFSTVSTAAGTTHSH